MEKAGGGRREEGGRKRQEGGGGGGEPSEQGVERASRQRRGTGNEDKNQPASVVHACVEDIDIYMYVYVRIACYSFSDTLAMITLPRTLPGNPVFSCGCLWGLHCCRQGPP